MIDIYCDESRQDLLTSENPTAQFTLIGSLWLDSTQRGEITEKMAILRNQYNVWGEIKWSKVSPSKENFYKSLIDLFFSYPKSLYFRCIVIDSTKIDNHLFNGGDGELGFYKFYYQVLYHWINDYPITCRVFCDIKENKDKSRLKTLFKVLQNTTNGTVQSVQALRSSDTPMLQLSDFLLGLTSASINRSVQPGSAKRDLIEYFESLNGNPIGKTNKTIKKFNVFYIKLRESN